MAAYFVVNAAITDPDLLASYRAATKATFEGHDVNVLVSTNEAEVMEGEPIGRRLVILRFPDTEAFHRWYESPAYQAIIGMRQDSTNGVALLAEGRD
jgi:uncharacterized protein (DUF1330 family)